MPIGARLPHHRFWWRLLAALRARTCEVTSWCGRNNKVENRPARLIVMPHSGSRWSRCPRMPPREGTNGVWGGVLDQEPWRMAFGDADFGSSHSIRREVFNRPPHDGVFAGERLGETPPAETAA
jgi:hypothetical protein